MNTVKPNQLEYVSCSGDWIDHLKKHGWSSVSINLTREELSDLRSDFIRHLANPNVKFLEGGMRFTGILKGGFGHTELQWSIRERCLPYFAKVYNCDPKDLLCSFDGGSFITPVNDPDPVFNKWLHHDHPAEYSEIHNGEPVYQGLVTLSSCGPYDGGLVLIETVLEFEDIPKNMQIYNNMVYESTVVSPEQMEILKDQPMKKICCASGSLILWDTRCFHFNVPPIGTENRMCIYVSMQPKKFATQEDIVKRIDYYERGIQTGHWCYGPWLAPVNEEVEVNNNTHKNVEIADLNSVRESMIGYN